jgi:hypothetical protein
MWTGPVEPIFPGQLVFILMTTYESFVKRTIFNNYFGCCVENCSRRKNRSHKTHCSPEGHGTVQGRGDIGLDCSGERGDEKEAGLRLFQQQSQ